MDKVVSSLPCFQLEDSLAHTSVLDGDADVRAACGVLCELSYYWNAVGWNHWAQAGGKKKPSWQPYRKSPEPPSRQPGHHHLERGLHAMLGLSERRSSFHNTLLSALSLSSAEALTIQPSVRSRLLHKSPPTALDCFVHRQEGGTGWTSLIRDCTK